MCHAVCVIFLCFLMFDKGGYPIEWPILKVQKPPQSFFVYFLFVPNAQLLPKISDLVELAAFFWQVEVQSEIYDLVKLAANWSRS